MGANSGAGGIVELDGSFVCVCVIALRVQPAASPYAYITLIVKRQKAIYSEYMHARTCRECALACSCSRISFALTCMHLNICIRPCVFARLLYFGGVRIRGRSMRPVSTGLPNRRSHAPTYSACRSPLWNSKLPLALQVGRPKRSAYRETSPADLSPPWRRL